MSTPDYNERMNELRNKVELFTVIPKNPTSSFKSTSVKSYFTYNTLYIIIPIVVMVLLTLIKPSFITISTIGSDNEIKKKLDFKKLLTTSLIVGFLIDIGIYMFLRKNRSLDT